MFFQLKILIKNMLGIFHIFNILAKFCSELRMVVDYWVLLLLNNN